MKKFLWLIPSFVILSSAASAKIVDRIVAQVNNDIITLSDLNREMAQVRQELAARYTGEQLEQEVKNAEKDVLEELIRQKLLLQKATELGFDANVDIQVSAYIERMRKENNIPDMQEFERALQQQGLTLASYREYLRNQIVTQSLVSEFVSSRITLLSEEVERYYKDHAAEFTTLEEVTLSEIIIPVEGSESEAKARAEEIHERLTQGEAFATMASQYSKGPTASKGGGIGTYQVQKLNTEIAKAIETVKEGDFTPLLRTKEDFTIYRVDSRKPAATRPLDEVRDNIKDSLFRQKFTPELERFVAQLKEDAYIQIFDEIK